MCNYSKFLFLKGPYWLQVRQWTFVFEKLFIRHL